MKATDLKSKISTKDFSVLVAIGIAKGSKMIAPNMASMLALMTDFQNIKLQKF